LGLLEVNEAAEIIHGVAHQDANIIFGTVIDDEMGDEVRVTVIAAGFDRWDDASPRPAGRSAREKGRPARPEGSGATSAAAAGGGRDAADPRDGDDELEEPTGEVPIADVFAVDDDDDLALDDDFDVPDFLK
ncbi:MAG: cell division protein FtsZ, partial [Acidimicrobiales bacterium]